LLRPLQDAAAWTEVVLLTRRNQAMAALGIVLVALHSITGGWTVPCWFMALAGVVANGARIDLVTPP
jgi:hypothetical protein